MQMLDNLAFWPWVIQVVVIFFIVGSLAGVAVGAGLVLNSSGTLAFFNKVNHWTSMRRTIKPFEIPRDTTAVVQRYMRLIAAIFVLGGAYSLYGLIAQFNPDAIVYGLRLGNTHPLLSGLLLDSIRWILIAGNLAAILIGLLMVINPDKLTALEARGSKWFSDRMVTQVGDRMHLPLDRWVAAAPRAAGVILGVGSFFVLVSAVFMLVSQR